MTEERSRQNETEKPHSYLDDEEMPDAETGEIDYRDFFENAPDICISIDAETASVIDCNKRMLEFTGYSKEEVIGRPVFDLYHRDSVEKARATFEDFRKTGLVENVHLRVRKKDGSGADVLLSASGARGENGEVLYSRSIWRDISDLSRLEKQLEEINNAQDKILSTTRHLLALMDVDFNFIRVNDAYASADGKTPDFFVGKNHFELYPNEENEKIFRRVTETGEPFKVYAKPFTYPHNPERGTSYWDWTLDPIKNKSGRVEKLVLTILDVTDRQKAEESAIRAGDLLEKTISSLSEVLFIVDPATRNITACNDAVEKIFGYRKEEVIGRNTEFLHVNEETYAEFGKKLFPALSSRGVFNCEFRMRRKDGKIILTDHTAKEILGEGGKRIAVVSVVRDITERRRMEEVMRLERARLLGILGSMPEGVCIISKENEIEYVNPALEKEFGPVKGRKCHEYFHNKTDSCEWCRNKEVFEGNSFRWEWDCPKNGKYYELFDTPFRNEDGTVSKLEIFHDITALKQAEKSLKLFKHLINHSNDAIFLIDPASARFIDINEKACSNLGYVREELLTMGVTDIEAVLPDEFSWQGHVNTMRDIGSAVMEGVHRRKDGSTFPVEVSTSFIKEEAGEYLVAVARDVSDRKMAEEALARQNTSLKNAMKELKKVQTMLVRQEKLASIGTLSAGVTHEILNPLNIIGTIVQARQYEDCPESLREDFEEIMRMVRRATKIANCLRMFAHQKKAETHPLHLPELFEKAVALMEHDMNLENITVERDYREALPAVDADEDQMAEVFLNLLSNAKDALKGQGGGTIKISMKRERENVEIRLSDNGPGIPEENIKKIFDPFFTTKDPGQGTGLGLSLVFSIIENHGGMIRVDSTKGEGAAFTITLPAAHAGQGGGTEYDPPF